MQPPDSGFKSTWSSGLVFLLVMVIKISVSTAHQSNPAFLHSPGFSLLATILLPLCDLPLLPFQDGASTFPFTQSLYAPYLLFLFSNTSCKYAIPCSLPPVLCLMLACIPLTQLKILQGSLEENYRNSYNLHKYTTKKEENWLKFLMDICALEWTVGRQWVWDTDWSVLESSLCHIQAEWLWSV